MTQRLPTALARKDFANVLRDSAAGERIKLTRYNKTVAVIIPTKDLADLEDCQKLRAVEDPSEQPPSEKPARSPILKAPSSKLHSKLHRKSAK